MKQNTSIFASTRWECIRGHLIRMLHEGRVSVAEYSEDVLAMWLARTPLEARSAADFRERGPIDERMAANKQKIDRWIKPNVSARPSIDVEEALVLAMRGDYREACLRDLALRYNALYVQLIAGSDAGLGNAGYLLKEWGEALIALGKLLADGKIDASDSTEDLLRARSELVDVQAGVQGMIGQIDLALDQQRVQQEHGDRVALLRVAR